MVSAIHQCAVPADVGVNMGPPALKLPEDLWVEVAQRLSPVQCVRLASACKQFAWLADSHPLWEGYFKERHEASSSHSRLSSNEMGGCANHLAQGGPQQALRAMEMLSGQQQQGGSGAVAQPKRGKGGDGAGTGPHPTPCLTSWKELFNRSIALEQRWACGRSSGCQVLEGHNDLIRCLQLSGNTLVTCSGSTSHTDCSARVWDVPSGRCRRVLRGHMGPIWCMQYEPSIDRIATGSEDYTVRYWDASSGNSVSMEDPGSAVRCVHMDAEGRQLVAGTEFGRLLLWDLDHLEEVLADAVQHVVEEFERQADDAGPVWSGGGPPPTGPHPHMQGVGSSRRRRPSSRVSMAQRASCYLQGRHVSVDASNHVRLMDAAEEGKAISAIQVQQGLCATTSIEPLSGIQLWDVSRNSWVPAGHLADWGMQYANSLSFDKQLGVLVAGCGDKQLRVWDLRTGQRLHVLSGHTGDIYAHQFDANTLASAGLDGRICVWDLRSGARRHVLQHNAPLHAFQFKGDRLVSGTWDGRLCMWDLGRGTLVNEWYAHNERVWALAMDDFHVASAGLDHNVCLHSFVPTGAAEGDVGARAAALPQGSLLQHGQAGGQHETPRSAATNATTTCTNVAARASSVGATHQEQDPSTLPALTALSGEGGVGVATGDNSWGEPPLAATEAALAAAAAADRSAFSMALGLHNYLNPTLPLSYTLLAGLGGCGVAEAGMGLTGGHLMLSNSTLASSASSGEQGPAAHNTLLDDVHGSAAQQAAYAQSCAAHQVALFLSQLQAARQSGGMAGGPSSGSGIDLSSSMQGLSVDCGPSSSSSSSSSSTTSDEEDTAAGVATATPASGRQAEDDSGSALDVSVRPGVHHVRARSQSDATLCGGMQGDATFCEDGSNGGLDGRGTGLECSSSMGSRPMSVQGSMSPSPSMCQSGSMSEDYLPLGGAMLQQLELHAAGRSNCLVEDGQQQQQQVKQAWPLRRTKSGLGQQ